MIALRIAFRRLCVLIALIAAPGCGGGQAPVTGVVTLDDKPLADAVVTFKPKGATPGLGGAGKTDADGKFKIASARGETGLADGEYKVIISRFRRKDGSAPDPKAPPIESDASETLPPIYSDPEATKLTATVKREFGAYDFKLQTLKAAK